MSNVDKKQTLALGEPEASSHAVFCEFSTGLSAAKVILDSESGMIHFGNCHTPRRFLGRTPAWHSCKIGDLKGVHRYCLKTRFLTVVTESGKANIPETATHYQEIQQYLMEAVPANQPEYATDNPIMGFVYLGGAIGGFVGGAAINALLIPNAATSTLGLYCLIGAFCGVVACYLTVLLAGHWHQIDLAQPIGYGTVGAVFGFVLVGGLGPFIGWPVTPVIVAVLFGATGGVIVGYSIDRKKQQNNSEPEV